jgi:hypothetical protein
MGHAIAARAMRESATECFEAVEIIDRGGNPLNDPETDIHRLHLWLVERSRTACAVPRSSAAVISFESSFGASNELA